jgi:hypothetical protein
MVIKQSSGTGAAVNTPSGAAALRLRQAQAFCGSAASFWVVVGFLWLALCVYCWGSWVFGPDFVPNTVGRELAPVWYVRMVRGVEIFSVTLTTWLIYRFVVRPWRRTGRLSFDGLFLLACGTLYIQEPWLNMIRPQLLYSTVFINFGSWCGYVPGWSAPHPEKIPVALVAWGLAYFWIVGAPAWCGSRFMAWLRTRNPTMSKTRLLGLCFLGFCIFDLVIESIILRTGMFVYPSTISSLTLFAGQKYQFPLYEMLHWCATYTALASVHFFLNDRGQTYAERGLENLQLPKRLHTFVRWVAIMGLCQTAMLVTYNIPYQFWALHGDKFPNYEKYLLAGLCGADTPYDCHGPGVLLARRDTPTNRIQQPLNCPVNGSPVCQPK